MRLVYTCSADLSTMSTKVLAQSILSHAGNKGI